MTEIVVALVGALSVVLASILPILLRHWLTRRGRQPKAAKHHDGDDES
jgi:hypothetical protein